MRFQARQDAEARKKRLNEQRQRQIKVHQAEQEHLMDSDALNAGERRKVAKISEEQAEQDRLLEEELKRE